MSIHNDYRQYGTEEEWEEWMQELKDEYFMQEAYDKWCDERREYEQSDD